MVKTLNKFMRAVAAVAASHLILYAFESVKGFESVWLSLFISVICVYLIMFTNRSYHYEQRCERHECILNLHNDTAGEIFNPSNYPDYKLSHSSSEGNDYISPSGEAICTTFAMKNIQVKVFDGGIAEHILCISVIGITLLGWYAFSDAENLRLTLEPHFSRLWYNVYTLWDYLRQTLLSILSKINLLMANFDVMLNNILNNIRKLIQDIITKF